MEGHGPEATMRSDQETIRRANSSLAQEGVNQKIEKTLPGCLPDLFAGMLPPAPECRAVDVDRICQGVPRERQGHKSGRVAPGHLEVIPLVPDDVS